MLTENQKEIISNIAEYVKNEFKDDGTGHDWWHIYRVWQTSIKLAEKIDSDMFIVQLAALYHDIADWKYNDGNILAGPEMARKLMGGYDISEEIIFRVCKIIENISFKGAGEENKISSIEGMIVQDADRLDAIGAIGVARTFAYGGSRNRLMYDPAVSPLLHKDFEEYKSNTSPTVNHFYEKLLLLKDLMNTEMGKRIAQERHEYLEEFLNQFYREWNGEDI